MKLLATLPLAAMLLFSACSKEDDLTTQASKDLNESSKSLMSGAVYVMDNATSGNNIIAFSRDNDGTLSPAGSFPTGGTGTGMGLGSQGSLIREGNSLFAVNAGSNQISVLSITGTSLTLLDTIHSGGIMPISVTVHNNLLYVLNAGGSGNISGFMIDMNGNLAPIPGSTQSLSSPMAGPAQIEFNQDGSYLVVTEKMTNMITVYPVDANGVAGMGTSYPSAGQTPFGFAFGIDDNLIVSEAVGGAPDQSTVSSYSFDGTPALIEGPVPTTETAACWVVITNNGRYAYTTNTGSNSITGYHVSNTGDLTILDADGVTGQTEGGPIDMSLSVNSKYLYTLNSMANSISMFAVNKDGSLSDIGKIGGLPVGSVGMAAK